MKPTGLFGWYGQKGTLKTTTWMMAPPEFRPISVFDSDKGAPLRMASLALTKEQRDSLGGVHTSIYDACGPWIKEGVRLNFLDPAKPFDSCVRWAQGEGDDKANPAKLLIWDTASTTARWFLEECIQSEGIKSMTRTIGGREFKSASEAEYGIAQGRVMDIMRVLDARDAHVVIIAHEKTSEIKRRKDDKNETGRIVVGPRTIGNALTEEIPTYLDLCLRFESRSKFTEGKIKNYVVVRSTDHEGMYLAGDRSGLFHDEQELDPISLWKKIGALIKLATP